LNSRGVTGFFEDIPALMVVTIGLFIFVLSLVHLVGTFADARDDFNMDRDGYLLLGNIKSYEEILVNASYTKEYNVGRFDADKLDRLNESKINRDLHIGKYYKYRYNIEIKDFTSVSYVGQKINKVREGNWSYGESVPSHVEKSVVYSTTIAIRHGIFDYNVGYLKVTIWR